MLRSSKDLNKAFFKPGASQLSLSSATVKNVRHGSKLSGLRKVTLLLVLQL